jgi:diguanylate cyclase (GGDEF)-like protein
MAGQTRVLRKRLDAGRYDPSCFVPEVTDPTPTHAGADESTGRIRWNWRLFVGSFFVLGLLLVFRLWVEPRPLDLVIAALLVVVGFAAVRHHQEVNGLEVERRSAAESFARILQGLSRSVSPDAIVEAIVGDLAAGTGADHVVVARRRPPAHVLEATLVSTRPGVPSSRTIFPIADLEDPAGALDPSDRGQPPAIPVGLVALPAAAAPTAGSVVQVEPVSVAGPTSPITRVGDAAAADRVADRIAARVRDVYGLKHSISAPLQTGGRVVGAIVLSRRTAGPWPATSERMLAAAAVEASAALTRHHSIREAEERASTDALTGLPNRRYFDEFCGLLARRRRAEDAIGVLMVDVDRFKRLNDRFGHAVGDEVLRAVGSAIASAVREHDVPARFGGEEFAVLLRNPSRNVAVEIGERVRAAVGALDLRPLGVPGVSVSVGVATATTPDQPIDDVIAAADRALYRAKRAGRDRVMAA